MEASNTTSRQRAGRWLRYLFPATGYALAQLPIFAAFLMAIFEPRGTTLGLDMSYAARTLLLVVLSGAIPAVVIGLADGLFRTARSETLRVAGGMLVSLMVFVMGTWTAIVGTIIVSSYGETITLNFGFEVHVEPIPLVVSTSALLAMEAVLALSWIMAWALSQASAKARELRDNCQQTTRRASRRHLWRGK